MTDVNVWQVNLLRLTVFPEPDYEVETDWWEMVVGEVPEQKNSQPRQNITRYEGSYDAGKLILSVQPTRIDWILRSVNDPGDTDSDTLGLISDTSEPFISLMHKWLQMDTSLNILRIAFGAILEQPVVTPQEGYELLESKYLKFNPHFDSETTDFLFQINRPRDSNTIDDLRINRLTKWSVSKSQTILMLPVKKIFPESFAVRVEIDVNSDPNFGKTLSLTETESLLSELANFGFEIAEKGDVK